MSLAIGIIAFVVVVVGLAAVTDAVQRKVQHKPYFKRESLKDWLW